MGNTLDEVYYDDSTKTTKVAIYLFHILIDREAYGGHIPAKSWRDAEETVKKFNGKIVGRVAHIMETDKICSICGGEVTRDLSVPKSIDIEDEFPDIID